MAMTNLMQEKVIGIDKIVAFHYQELPKDFSGREQKNNFWEMIYVDQGEFTVIMDSRTHHLKQGEIVFSPPRELHRGRANVQTPPNIFSIGFECQSVAMQFFTRKSFRLGDQERRLLTEIVREGLHAPTEPLLFEGVKKGRNKQGGPRIGCEQLVKNQLENLFIYLLRKGATLEESLDRLSSVQKERHEKDMAYQVIDYIESADMSELCLGNICQFFSLSKTHLSMIFKRTTGCCVMEYVRKLKITKAKTLIREEKYYYTEIAELLGYSSIHYFSKDFKKWTGMPPSEYAKTVKIRV